MSDTSLVALKVGPSTTELREFDLPDLPPDAALLKVEVAGVCGTDVSQYKLPLRGAPLIMGHENVGYLARVGRDFERLKGFKEGDLVFLEHYLPCGHCEWDHIGEYRHCAATEWFYDPTAIRYGYTAIDIKPSLWGGFSHYVYLPLNAVLHAVPAGLSPEEAGIATPMSNGIQWTLIDGGAGSASTVLIQGECGAGKTLVARAIVEQSPRADAPFVHVDCAATPVKLLDGTIFGFDRADRLGAPPGAFELARGGHSAPRKRGGVRDMQGRHAIPSGDSKKDGGRTLGQQAITMPPADSGKPRSLHTFMDVY